MSSSLKSVLLIAKSLFALFLAYFALRLVSYHFALTTFQYPVALREGAMMTSTVALVKGLNPYDMSLQPQFMNQYGIIYPLFVYPLAKVFGITLLIHRIVTAIFIFASCTLTYFVLKRMNVAILLRIWAVLMLYASLLYPATSTPTIDPGATGMFFFLLTIFIPWFCRYSYRSLAISVVCGILAFYTKVYDFLGVLIVLSYLFLFISKSKGLFYGFFLLILSVVCIMLVNQILPAYFDNCFFTSANMAPAWSSMERLYEQITKYGDLHKWLFILVGITLLWESFKVIRNNPWANIKNNMDKAFLSFNLKHFHEPLVKFRLPLVLYAGLCVSFVLYMSLGRNSGAMLWYFFQLLSPFMLIGTAWLFSRNSFWPLCYAPFLILNLYTMTINHNYKIFDKKIPGWSDISMAIDQYQHVLNSPVIAPLLIEQNKEIIDDGQAEYFLSGGQRNYWMKGWLKEDDRIYIQQIKFFDNIRSKVENKEFDLILLQPSLLPLGVDDEIRKYYKCEGEVMLYAPQDQRSYAISAWKPI